VIDDGRSRARVPHPFMAVRDNLMAGQRETLDATLELVAERAGIARAARAQDGAVKVSAASILHPACVLRLIPMTSSSSDDEIRDRERGVCCTPLP